MSGFKVCVTPIRSDVRIEESCKCVKVAGNSPQIDGEAARKGSGTRPTHSGDSTDCERKRRIRI